MFAAPYLFVVRAMKRLALILALATCAVAAHGAIFRGRVFDASGRPVAGARVIAVHNVPLIEIYDHAHPPWNGLLGETHTDGNGYFALQTSDRASVDLFVAHIHHLVGAIGRAPVQQFIRINLHREGNIHGRLRRILERPQQQ